MSSPGRLYMKLSSLICLFELTFSETIVRRTQPAKAALVLGFSAKTH
jgi:hypothetical protein